MSRPHPPLNASRPCGVSTYNPMTRRAFTLVELLVVIAIMVTLMGLIMGGVMIAKRSAMRAKAVSMLGTLSSAVDQYRSLNNSYPERLVVTSAMGLPAAYLGKEIYAEIFAPSGSVQAATAITPTMWEIVNQALVYQLGSQISDQAVSGKLLDPWKTPLRYRPAKWYAYIGGTTDKPRIDRQEPPGLDTYQAWSAGVDTKDDTADPGEGGDDVPIWSKASP